MTIVTLLVSRHITIMTSLGNSHRDAYEDSTETNSLVDATYAPIDSQRTILVITCRRNDNDVYTVMNAMR